MGCGASKGESEDGKKQDPMNVKFGHTYCWSIDRFFEEAQRVVDDFKDMIDPIEKEKTNFLYVSGFHEVCGACKIFRILIIHFSYYSSIQGHVYFSQCQCQCKLNFGSLDQ